MQKDLPTYSYIVRTSNMLPDRSEDLVFDETDSLTQQQFLAECDINNIVKSNASGAMVTHLNERTPHFGDFGDATDFQSHQNYMAEAQSAFNSLPAEVRARFKNNPAELLDFVSQEKNQDEAIALGLATRRETQSESFSAPDGDTLPKGSQKLPKKPPEEAGE